MSSPPESTQPPLAGLPPPGTVLDGKYVVESVLGVGGMGGVLLAKDSLLGQRVAIKVLLPRFAEQAVMVGRFLREAQAAAAIQNDNVVRIYSVGKTEKGLPFIVMEHLTGIGLDEAARSRSPLAFSDIADIMLELCRALSHAHTLGIIHRDLKPSNLFVCRCADGSERIKVLDFGISKLERREGDQSLTSTSEVFGTPMYMSPEQARCTKDVDARTDIWSFGVVCYELACGVPPFVSDSLSAMVAKIVADEPTPPRELRPDIPEQLERLILWCLQKDPERRPRTIREMVPFLRSLASPRGRTAADSIHRLHDSGLLATAVQLDLPTVAGRRASGLFQSPLLSQRTVLLAVLLVVLVAGTYVLATRSTGLPAMSAPPGPPSGPVIATQPSANAVAPSTSGQSVPSAIPPPTISSLPVVSSVAAPPTRNVPSMTVAPNS